MIWWSIPSYFAAHASAEAKKKYRNNSQKKKYITDTLGMTLQFDCGCEHVNVINNMCHRLRPVTVFKLF